MYRAVEDQDNIVQCNCCDGYVGNYERGYYAEAERDERFVGRENVIQYCDNCLEEIEDDDTEYAPSRLFLKDGESIGNFEDGSFDCRCCYEVKDEKDKFIDIKFEGSICESCWYGDKSNTIVNKERKLIINWTNKDKKLVHKFYNVDLNLMAKSNWKGSNNREECYICFDDMSNQQEIRRDACNHSVCVPCHTTYLIKEGHYKCGMCRRV